MSQHTNKTYFNWRTCFSLILWCKHAKMVKLNNRVFTIQVTEEFGSPGYVCQSEQLSIFSLKNKDITDQLRINIPFHLFTIQIDKFSIIIYGLGVSTNENYLGAGPGYMFSFIHKYSQKRCNTSVEVWNKAKILGKFSGSSLFGLEHPTTQRLL
ncbi:14476_t:CDS:2 [Funneliformis mosseae]|uniref:14476_t:CDS:1 n=1 Tax=Funneliformis mosseae TaxID=27381 RepID=A0A9N9DMA4_FUNMO|nr:14476_t:CDS:2 [Funneliformis mosseae]